MDYSYIQMKITPSIYLSIYLSIYVASTDTQQIGSINLDQLYNSRYEVECGQCGENFSAQDAEDIAVADSLPATHQDFSSQSVPIAF